MSNRVIIQQMDRRSRVCSSPREAEALSQKIEYSGCRIDNSRWRTQSALSSGGAAPHNIWQISLELP